MKKFIAIILACTLCAVSAVGCGNTQTAGGSEAKPESSSQQAASSSKEEPSAPAEKVTLRMWQRNSGKGGPIYEYLQEYNQSQNEIEVQYEPYGENYENVVNIALASDDPPDIFEVQWSPISTVAQAGHIVPLDDVITDEVKKELHPSALVSKEFYYDGKLYSVPLRIGHMKLLYNKDLFRKAGLDPEKPPVTLEEMRDYAKKITEAGEGKAYGLGFYVNYGSIWYRYIDMCAIAAGETSTYGFDFKTGRFDFSYAKKYFENLVDIYNDGSMFPGATTLGVEQMRANFAQGTVGMMIDGSWMVTQFATNIPTEVDWDACYVPIFEGTKRAKDFMNCDVTFAVAAKGKHIDQSKAVFKNILENQMEFRKYGEADSKTYMKANTDEAFKLLPSDVTFRGLKNMNDVSNNSAFAIEPFKFIQLEGDNSETVFGNQFTLAIEGKGDIDAAIDDLTNRYNAALDKALESGALTQEEIKPEGFDYYTR